LLSADEAKETVRAIRLASITSLELKDWLEKIKPSIFYTKAIAQKKKLEEITQRQSKEIKVVDFYIERDVMCEDDGDDHDVNDDEDYDSEYEILDNKSLSNNTVNLKPERMTFHQGRGEFWIHFQAWKSFETEVKRILSKGDKDVANQKRIFDWIKDFDKSAASNFLPFHLWVKHSEKHYHSVKPDGLCWWRTLNIIYRYYFKNNQDLSDMDDFDICNINHRVEFLANMDFIASKLALFHDKNRFEEIIRKWNEAKATIQLNYASETSTGSSSSSSSSSSSATRSYCYPKTVWLGMNSLFMVCEFLNMKFCGFEEISTDQIEVLIF